MVSGATLSFAIHSYIHLFIEIVYCLFSSSFTEKKWTNEISKCEKYSSSGVLMVLIPKVFGRNPILQPTNPTHELSNDNCFGQPFFIYRRMNVKARSESFKFNQWNCVAFNADTDIQCAM